MFERVYISDTHSSDGVDDWGRTLGFLAVVQSSLLRHQSPQFVQVDGGTVGCILLQVIVPHAHFTKVPRVAEKHKTNFTPVGDPSLKFPVTEEHFKPSGNL